jgi:hypothetical protein
MTETEWLAWDDSLEMQDYLVSCNASSRKLRLFTVACCRRIWHLLTEEQCRKAVELAESYADGLCNSETLRVASERARLIASDLDDNAQDAADAAASTASEDVHRYAHMVIFCASKAVYTTYSAKMAERAAQADSLREIFGNPFRPFVLETQCLTPVVVSLAQAVYDSRILPAGTLDPTRLAILADALEDAGCTEAAILDHLRGPGPHVRGCFVVDLILAKT